MSSGAFESVGLRESPPRATIEAFAAAFPPMSINTDRPAVLMLAHYKRIVTAAVNRNGSAAFRTFSGLRKTGAAGRVRLADVWRNGAPHRAREEAPKEKS